jgi:hypothetical protein
VPRPTFRDLKRFCENDGWDPRKKTDHWRYTKTLPDGRTLRTKISFGLGEIHDPGLFAAILREQLDVSEADFWRVVREGGPARRTPRAAAPAAMASGLSAATVLQLRKLGVSLDRIKRLKTQDEAEQLVERLRSRSQR